MRGKRRIRLSYANVMATIAVFLTLGGASYAAVTLPANSVGRAQLKKAAVTPRKLSKTTKRYIARVGKGKAGPQGLKGDTGLRGARGERGPQGQRGLPGADGATWSALLTGHGTSIPSSGGWSGVPSPREPERALRGDRFAGNRGRPVPQPAAPSARHLRPHPERPARRDEVRLVALRR